MSWYWSIFGSVDGETARSASGTRGRCRRRVPRRVEYLQRPAAQRNAVLALRLHPQGRHGPGAPCGVHLVLRREPDLRRPGGRQHEELERQHDGRLPGLRLPHRLDGRGHVLLSVRRFSERGSPPERANLRLARACSRASASGTSAAAPSPSSRRRPRTTSRWTQLRVPGGWTNRYRPLPSAWRPGGAERTNAAERALSGWRPRRLALRQGNDSTNTAQYPRTDWRSCQNGPGMPTILPTRDRTPQRRDVVGGVTVRSDRDAAARPSSSDGDSTRFFWSPVRIESLVEAQGASPVRCSPAAESRCPALRWGPRDPDGAIEGIAGPQERAAAEGAH